MKRWIIAVSLLFGLSLLAGCSPQSSIPLNYRWASVQSGQVKPQAAGEEFYFTVPVDQQNFGPSAVPVHIQVDGNVISGTLRFELRSPDKTPVWSSGDIGPGDFAISTDYRPEEGVEGDYTIGMVWKENTEAGYNLAWRAFKLGPVLFIPGAGMTLVALAFVAYSAARRLGWRYLGLGALFWTLTVALKFAFAIPVNPLVYRALNISYENLWSAGNVISYIYLGALTGIFEAGVAWAILRKSRWGRATWGQALAFGIGFGAFEALLLGFAALGTSLVAITSPSTLPVPTLAGLAQNTMPVMGFGPVVERLSIITAHIFTCVLIFTAIARREAKWGWLAVLYKTILDAPAGFAQFWGVNTPEKLWTIEGVLLIIALAGLAGIIVVSRRYPGPSEVPQPEPVPVPAS